MTIAEAHIDLQLGLDKVGSTAPELGVVEADLWINKAQLRYIKTHYGKNNLYQVGYEEIQKRREDLKGIIKTKYGKPVIADNYYKVNLSDLYEDINYITSSVDEYMFLVKVQVNTSKGICNITSDLKIINQDKVEKSITDPFNKSTYNYPKGYYEDGSIYILTPNFIVNNILITFIKYPKNVKYGTQYSVPTLDIEFEISKHTHDEIIQLAVSLIIENNMSQRIQTINMSNNTIE